MQTPVKDRKMCASRAHVSVVHVGVAPTNEGMDVLLVTYAEDYNSFSVY